MPSAIVGATIALLGFWILIWPRWFLYVTHGWWYENPQDVRFSHAYLVWNIIQAVSVIMVGLALVVASAPR